MRQPVFSNAPHEAALFGCAVLFLIGSSILAAGGYFIVRWVLS